MITRQFTAAFLVAGLTVGACGGSDDSPTTVPADPVEDATPADDVSETAVTGATEPPSDEAVATEDPEVEASLDEEADQDSSAEEPVEAADEQMFPDVIDATASMDGSTWTVAATLSSPYDTPERYADAWRVVGPDGTVYGERILTHDHASEQPFTRSETGIEIPDDVTTVTIEGRDLQFGYGGDTFELALSR